MLSRSPAFRAAPASRFLAALSLAGLAALGCPAPLRAAEPEPIRMSFDAFGASLRVLTVKAELTEAPTRYAVTLDLETRGAADLLLNLKSRVEVRGRVAGDAFLPDALRAESHTRLTDRHTRIDYGSDGSIAAESLPLPTDARTPVTPEQMRGTVDELTAYLMIARRLERQASCAATIAVFDGRRRLTLNVADLGPDVVPPGEDGRYAGPAHLCQTTTEPIAGYPVDRGRKEGAGPGKIWFARLAPDVTFLPVLMQLDGQLGSVTIHLTRVEAPGLSRRFGE